MCLCWLLAGSVNLRLRNGRGGLREVEVAAFVGPRDMRGEHRAVAALVARALAGARRASAVEPLASDIEIDAAPRDVDLIGVARLQHGWRPPDKYPLRASNSDSIAQSKPQAIRCVRRRVDPDSVRARPASRRAAVAESRFFHC